MGNRNGQSSSEQFREEDWQRREELPECQVWQSKLEPQLRIQSHDIYTQNTAEVERECRMFELRKRSPLLVAAYFLQLQPKEEFCSFHNRHSLFIQRVPIRLSDIEHVPYPDYLHLYDSCIKGYAQLARQVGYFIVDEGMVGINQQCIAKAWLSEDFASNTAFNTKVTEEAMVCSLLQTLQRSIDVEDLPPNVPLFRDFINRGKGARGFDSLLWQFGDFVRIYNYGQIPIRLDCIYRAGGITVIANREKGSKLGRSNVSNRKIGSPVKGSQVGGGRFLQNNIQTRSTHLIQPANSLPNAYQNQVIYYPQQTYQSQVRNPVVLQQNELRRSQITILPSLPIAQHFQQVIQQPQPQLYYQSIHTSQVSPQQMFTHRVANAPKFTVQVIPGKVYPQKSSTIFLSSSKAIPAGSSQPSQTLDSIHPIIATSQKDVIKEDEHQAQQIHSLINSESGNMRSYTVDEEKYSPDNFCYERENHQIGKHEPELQPYIPHMQATAAFNNVETIREPGINQELLVSFNPATLSRDVKEAGLPVYSREEEWQNQAHFTSSEGELSPRDEENVIEYADNREGLLQSANFGLQSYSNEAYNAAPLIEKEEEPTIYDYGSYAHPNYSGFDHNDGKSSLQLMRELAGNRAFLSNQSQTATEPSYRPSASTSEYYSKYLATLTQELPSFPQESQIRGTGTFRL